MPNSARLTATVIHRSAESAVGHSPCNRHSSQLSGPSSASANTLQNCQPRLASGSQGCRVAGNMLTSATKLRIVGDKRAGCMAATISSRLHTWQADQTLLYPGRYWIKEEPAW